MQLVILEFAKTLGLENIVIDGISAQHPYGAIVADKLAESVFIEEATNLKNLLTDKAIEEAQGVWPQNIYDLDAHIISK